jgi:hypothetical protein
MGQSAYRRPLQQILVIAACLVVLGAVYGPYLLEALAIRPVGDNLQLTAPIFCEMSRDSFPPLLDWSTFEATYYSPHLAAYYPFYFTYLLDFCDPTKAAQSNDIVSLFHLCLFFGFTVVLGMASRLQLVAAVVFATLTTVSVALLWLAVWPTIIAAAAWTPLAFAGLVFILFRGKILIGLPMFVTGIVLMLMAGPGSNMIAPVAFVVWVWGIVAVARWVFLGRWREMGAAILAGLVALMSIALMSLGSTVNLLLHLPEIIRWSRTGAVIGHTGPADPKELLAELATWKDLFEVLVPGARFLGVGSFEIGALIVCAAVVGVYLCRHRLFVRVFAALFLVAFAIAFLLPPSLLVVWSYVPGMGHTRHLSLLAMPMVMSASFLASVGMIQLGSHGLARRDAFAVAAIFLLTLVAVLAAWPPAGPIRSSTVLYGTVLGVGLVAPAVMAALSARGTPLLVLTVIVVSCQGWLVVSNAKFFRHDGTPEVVKTAKWRDVSQAVDWIGRTDPEPGQLVFVPEYFDGTAGELRRGMVAAFKGIPTFQFYASPRIYWKMAAGTSPDGSPEWYGQLSGKYVVSDTALSDSRFTEVYSAGSVRVYRINGFEPWVSVRCLPNLSAFGTSDADAQPGRLPPVPTGVEGVRRQVNSSTAGCAASVGEPTWSRVGNRVAWETAASATDRLLVINLPPYADWRLTVGGKALPAYSLDDRQIVVPVAADVSGETVLAFVPTRYFAYLTISAIAAAVFFLGWGLVYVYTARARRRADLPVTAS